MKYIRLIAAFMIIYLLTSCSDLGGQGVIEPSATASPSQTSPIAELPNPATSLPVLQVDEAKKLVRELLENNAGCRLPCWWGITPGKTKWSEARQILEKTAMFIAEQNSNDVSYIDVQALLPYPYDFAKYMEHTYAVKDGIVDYIRVYNFNLAPNYFLPHFLESYGQPDEIWIRTFPKEEMGIQHFIIDLFYQELGILGEYSSGDPMNEVDGKIQNCLIPEMDTPFFHLWSPETQNLSFQEAKKFIDTTNLPEPKTLFEATGMDVETFFQTFKNPETKTCIETPKDLWE